MEKANFTIIFKLSRYKLITINNTHYLIDNDIKILSYIFPFTQWLTPCTAYQIENNVKDKLEYKPKGKKLSTSIAITCSLIAISISRVVSPIILGFEIIIPEIFILLPIIIFLVGTIYFRVLVSKSSKKRISEIVDLKKLEKVKIYLLPKSFKFILFVIFLPPLWIILSYGALSIYLQTRNLTFLLMSEGIFIPILFINLFAYDVKREYGVIFSKKR